MTDPITLDIRVYMEWDGSCTWDGALIVDGKEYDIEILEELLKDEVICRRIRELLQGVKQ